MKKIIVPVLLLLLIGQQACKKEVVNTTRYIYDVKEQELYQSSAQKQTLKTTTQFITIAYNDLFNQSITLNELNKLNTALQSFGDKAVVEDMIIKALLSRNGVIITDNATMRADIPTFVNQTYLRFYNRKPNEFEAWKMLSLIQQNTDITPQMVYYSILTSDEYKYY